MIDTITNLLSNTEVQLILVGLGGAVLGFILSKAKVLAAKTATMTDDEFIAAIEVAVDDIINDAISKLNAKKATKASAAKGK